MGDAWCVVQSKPRQEDRAEANLARLPIELFLPRTRRLGRRRRARSETEPLFPGYLFARGDVVALGHTIAYTRGVARILAINDRPALVDASIVDLIRRRVGPDGLVRLLPTIAIGDRVRITDGPLRDVVAILQDSRSSAERITLLLSVVHSNLRVTIAPDQIERLSGPGDHHAA
jgi:transcriptional antiterminator RfaH